MFVSGVAVMTSDHRTSTTRSAITRTSSTTPAEIYMSAPVESDDFVQQFVVAFLVRCDHLEVVQLAGQTQP